MSLEGQNLPQLRTTSLWGNLYLEDRGPDLLYPVITLVIMGKQPHGIQSISGPGAASSHTGGEARKMGEENPRRPLLMGSRR